MSKRRNFQPEPGAETERIAELERLLGRLAMELEIAQKASPYFTSTMNRSGR